MNSDRDTDVLVVGAGPVGLVAALSLAERGIRVRVVDKYSRTALRSYALALHPCSLRLLDELGVGSMLAERGHRLETIEVHHEAGSDEIDVSRVGGTHPYVLTLPQSILEGTLEKRLADHGVGVEWNRQALMFDTGAEGVSVLLADNAGTALESDGDTELATQRVTATFLIGADGCESIVRRLLGIEQTVGETMVFGLMEFEKPLESPSRMHVVLGRNTTNVLWPLGEGHGRWTVQLDDLEPREDAARIKNTVLERAPWFGREFGTIDWVTTVGFESRLARRFGLGPVWLVGDAARFTSPIGVQSMNVGFREAHDFARRIAGILREGRSPRLLDYYNEERQREWKMMLGLKDRVRTDGRTPAWAAAAAGSLVSSLPASGHDLNLLLEQVGVRLYWLRRRV